MIKKCKMLYGEGRRPVTAELSIGEDLVDSYFTSAVFEDSGEYLNESQLLILESDMLTLLEDEVFYE